MTEAACVTMVRVKKLRLLADIGINPDEIGRRQPLVICIKLTLDAPEVDTLADTVDYRMVTQAAEDLAREHVPLIETFAQRLAGRCLEFAAVTEARVIVRKPFALTRGTAGTEVHMRRTG